MNLWNLSTKKLTKESMYLKRLAILFIITLKISIGYSQSDTLTKIEKPISKEKEALKYNLNDDGSHYFQATFLNQVWLRYNESNSGTTIMGKAANETFDIGLRRTRIQLFGQITDKVFVYFQFGQNNFNSMYASSPAGNRKFAAFFHDALCEYKITKKNQLKLGGGLTIANGLSRFSQPSIGSILTLDVPVFAQATVDQTDEFSRKLSVYARGQIYKFDYRFSLSDPFPITSNGSAVPAISQNSSFATLGHHKQYQGYLMYQFFEHEGHTTPYMTGTNLGKKKIFNIAGGLIYQKNALWNRTQTGDTSFSNMMLWNVESYLDIPVNKEKGTAVSAYVGYFNYNFGKNYLRYNGIMNPANGSVAPDLIASNAFGNAFPMFGTGEIIYSQLGFLLSKNLLGEKNGQLLPYVSLMSADFDRLRTRTKVNTLTNVFDIGLNWLMNGHKAKFTIDYQLRPEFYLDINGNTTRSGKSKNGIIFQYQIFI